MPRVKVGPAPPDASTLDVESPAYAISTLLRSGPFAQRAQTEALFRIIHIDPLRSVNQTRPCHIREHGRTCGYSNHRAPGGR